MKPEGHHYAISNGEKVAGFQVLESQCVWMRAGIINFRICENNYDCANCAFDRSMGGAMAVQSPNSELSKKECIWMRASVVNFHMCGSDDDCYHCTFDKNMRAAMAV